MLILRGFLKNTQPLFRIFEGNLKENLHLFNFLVHLLNIISM